MSLLTLEQRDRRWRKIREAMKKRNFDCLVVWGSTGGFGGLAANLRYLSNITEQGYLVFPFNGDPMSPPIFSLDSSIVYPVPITVSGNHDDEGIILIKGPKIKSGKIHDMSLPDIVPLIYSILNLKLPDHLEGKNITRLKNKIFLPDGEFKDD